MVGGREGNVGGGKLVVFDFKYKMSGEVDIIISGFLDVVS